MLDCYSRTYYIILVRLLVFATGTLSDENWGGPARRVPSDARLRTAFSNTIYTRRACGAGLKRVESHYRRAPFTVVILLPSFRTLPPPSVIVARAIYNTVRVLYRVRARPPPIGRPSRRRVWGEVMGQLPPPLPPLERIIIKRTMVQMVVV